MKHFFGLLVFSVSLAVQGHEASVSIMAYNAENLFDATHDEGTNDWTYLPVVVKKASPEVQKFCQAMTPGNYQDECFNLDWTDSVYRKKLANIASIIRAFGIKGAGPDVVVLEEIESIGVLDALITTGLKGMGYSHRVLIESDDKRGIDVGLISRHPIISATRHPIFLEGKKLNTRGVLEVRLDVQGKKLVVLGNHWPSQANPVAHRIASAELVASLAAAHTADFIVAVGDFNTIDTDRPYPFDIMSQFVDSETEARKRNVELNPGTYLHNGRWNSLDRLFVRQGGASTPDWLSFQILAEPWMLENSKRSGPKRFDPTTGQGFSDHLPVGIKIFLR